MSGLKSQEAYHFEQIRFILSIGKLYQQGRDFVWFDETSINLWYHRGKVWQNVDDPISIQLPERGKSITIFGALCSKDGRFVYDVGRSTNKFDLVRFFEEKLLPILEDFERESEES